MKIMVIVDCQKDFIDGSLGTAEAQAMIPRLIEKIKAEPENTLYVFTRDTHGTDYLKSDEGKQLPVEHCIKDTPGWEIDTRLTELFANSPVCIDKPTFGSVELGQMLKELNGEEPIEKITFVGLCTDICVISNAMIAKAYLPEVKIAVDAACCAGVTVDTHNAALATMKMCQINVIGE